MKNANGLGKVNDCIEAERKTKKIGHRVCPAAGSAEGVPQ